MRTMWSLGIRDNMSFISVSIGDGKNEDCVRLNMQELIDRTEERKYLEGL